MFPHIPGVYNLTKQEYLEANRRGMITPEQAALLGTAGGKFIRKFQPGSKPNGIVVILVLVFFIAIQTLGIEISTPIVLGAFGLALIVLAVQIGRRWVRSQCQERLLAADLERGVIHNSVGTLQFGKDAYVVVLPGRELQLPLGSKEGLTPEVSYRFYYLPESGVVLSAESL